MQVTRQKFDVYIVTNLFKTVLYVGVTNDLCQRITEHYLNRGKAQTFAGRYNCFFLVYHESFRYISDAIIREKEIKVWDRKQKDNLITSFNPTWETLNKELFGEWPPDNLFHRKDL